jgi:hypothetical protein
MSERTPQDGVLENAKIQEMHQSQRERLKVEIPEHPTIDATSEIPKIIAPAPSAKENPEAEKTGVTLPESRMLDREKYQESVKKQNVDELVKYFDVSKIVTESMKSPVIPETFSVTNEHNLKTAYEYFISIGIKEDDIFKDTFAILLQAINSNPYEKDPAQMALFKNPDANLNEIRLLQPGDFGKDFATAYQNFNLMRSLSAKANNGLISAVTHAKERAKTDGTGALDDVKEFGKDIAGAFSKAWREKDWVKLALFGGGIFATYKLIQTIFPKGESGKGGKWFKGLALLGVAGVGVGYLLKESGHDLIGDAFGKNTDKELFGPMKEIVEKHDLLKNRNIDFETMARISQVDAAGLDELKENAQGSRKIAPKKYPSIFKLDEFDHPGKSEKLYNVASGLEQIYYNIIQEADKERYGKLTYQQFLGRHPGITVAGIVSIATLLENMPRLQAQAEQYQSAKETLVKVFGSENVKFSLEKDLGINEQGNLKVRIMEFPILLVPTARGYQLSFGTGETPEPYEVGEVINLITEVILSHPNYDGQVLSQDSIEKAHDTTTEFLKAVVEEAYKKKFEITETSTTQITSQYKYGKWQIYKDGTLADKLVITINPRGRVEIEDTSEDEEQEEEASPEATEE